MNSPEIAHCGVCEGGEAGLVSATGDTRRDSRVTTCVSEAEVLREFLPCFGAEFEEGGCNAAPVIALAAGGAGFATGLVAVEVES